MYLIQNKNDHRIYSMNSVYFHSIKRGHFCLSGPVKIFNQQNQYYLSEEDPVSYMSVHFEF